MTSARDDARAIFRAAVEAVDPVGLIRRELAVNRELASAINNARQIVVVGGGKAGAAMTVGVEVALADQLHRITGLVNVPDALVRPTKRINLVPARPAGCNEPTDVAVAKTGEMLDLLAGLTADDIVICLLSGGGSALISAPAHGITLNEKISATRLLADRGAPIAELNCVRKHLSRVKGGQLAVASRAGSIWSLILSDVEDDRVDVIASGPTAPDPTTYGDALAIINRYRLHAIDPSNVLNHLERGAAGEGADTPKHLPESVHNTIIGNNESALSGAQAEAEVRGYRVIRLPPAFTDTAMAAMELSETARQAFAECNSPICILGGGETTVRLPTHHGLGGRNQQMALQLGMSLPAHATVLCASTDGEDGPTDAAGAIYDAEVRRAAVASELDGDYYLKCHDAYHYFEKTGGLFKTGLTGTNVMDVHLVLLQPKNVQSSA